MTWDLEGVGTASQSVESVEDAASWLVGSVKRSRRAFDFEWQWQLLLEAALRVRTQMLDEGRQSVERGEPWSSEDKGVKVRLSPGRHAA
jgi:hypothetical protein